jgi:hypothetical protein
MPMPTINDIMSPPAGSALGKARLDFAPVTEDNSVFQAKSGNGSWAGNKFVVSGVGLTNYWFIPAVSGQVSYCVVHVNGSGPAYVISDQYGGCEYHELYNAAYGQLAFLHVYRGDGRTVPYKLAPGWELRSVKRSANIAQDGGMRGSNWSFSMIDRSTNPPTVTSKFIHVEGYPNIRVTLEDDGDTPY